MTFGKRLTLYRIVRDHSDATGFFWIDVPEASHRGVGFQLNCRGTLYDISSHTRTKDSSS